MIKSMIGFILFTVFSMITIAQSCLPDGIIFKEQADIDNFQSDYPGCTEIEGFVRIQGDEISNLSGLSSITHIGGMLRFYTLKSLTNLSGLNNLITVGGDVDIYTWPGSETILSSLNGLNHLKSIGGDLSISGNSALSSLVGLDSLSTIAGSLSIAGNDKLSDLSGLEKLTYVGEDVLLGGNEILASLSGLENLATIEGKLDFYDCDALSNLSGLSGLISIGGTFMVSYCDNVTSLRGMDNLQSIGGYLNISQNTSLLSLEGLENIEPTSISNLYLENNPMLSYCEVKAICDFLALEGSRVTITDNANNCNSVEEVEEACTLIHADKNELLPAIAYPNPASKEISLNLEKGALLLEVVFYNSSGQKVLQLAPVSNTLNISALKKGLYAMEIHSTFSRTIHKLLVE